MRFATIAAGLVAVLGSAVVLGVVFGAPWFTIVAVAGLSALVAYRSVAPAPPAKSLPGAYHSVRASRVIGIASEIGGVLLLGIDWIGPKLGLHTFGAKMAFFIAYSALSWAAYQYARRVWPAGSD